MSNERLFDWLEKLSYTLNAANHRTMVMLQGDLTWALAIMHAWSENKAQNNTGYETVTVYSECTEISGDCYSKTYSHHLGTENDIVWFFDSDINVDALAALSGTIKGGGMLFLWLDNNIANHSNYFGRFSYIANESKGIYCIEQSGNEADALPKQLPKLIPEHSIEHSTEQVPIITSQADKNFSTSSVPSAIISSSDQQRAVTLIKAVLHGPRNKPLVITADRGRGKTTALAIACADLINQASSPLSIVITAPHRQSVNVFFSHLQHLVSGTVVKGNVVSVQQHSITFMPIDQLLDKLPKVQLVLVDEAAGIPVYLLNNLADHYRRLVFSSTVHGYEGAGRGFTQKFLKLLAKRYPQYKSIHLTQPIRWAKNDPLEALIFDGCLLNAELEDLECSTSSQVLDNELLAKHISNNQDKHLSKRTTVRINQQILLDDESLLQQVFAVLVTAHYQTKPSDLKLLLDSKVTELFVTFAQKATIDTEQPRTQQQVVAVALCMREGDLPADVKLGVQQGKRRVKSQLTPQTLMQQCVIEDAFDYRYLRVIRVAVHPDVQGENIGTDILAFIGEYASDVNIDIVSTSFAANKQVSNFWLNSGLSIVRLGFNKDASSGEHSALMLKSITTKAIPLVDKANQEFYRCFPTWLNDQYRHLAPSFVALLLSKNPLISPKAQVSINPSGINGQPPSDCRVNRDKQLLLAMSKNANLYHQTLPSLQRWLITHLVYGQVNGVDKSIFPLIAKILMKHSDNEVCLRFGFTGKKILYRYIQDYLIEHIGG